MGTSHAYSEGKKKTVWCFVNLCQIHGEMNRLKIMTLKLNDQISKDNFHVLKLKNVFWNVHLNSFICGRWCSFVEYINLRGKKTFNFC